MHALQVYQVQSELEHNDSNLTGLITRLSTTMTKNPHGANHNLLAILVICVGTMQYTCLITGPTVNANVLPSAELVGSHGQEGMSESEGQ